MKENEKIEATVMWFVRKILTISWTSKISNEGKIELTAIEKGLIVRRERQSRF